MAGAGGCAVNVFIVVCVILSLIASSASYTVFSLENDKVCSMIRKRELKLAEGENSAISLKELRYFDKWSGAYPFSCSFTVYAPQGYGIIAVIQNLSFRQNKSSSGCIDYVQFQKKKSIFSILKQKTYSKQFCGIVNSIQDPDAEKDDHDSHEIAHNAYIDEEGHLDVTIKVADQQLSLSEKLDVEIVFTAFKPCKYGDSSGFLECKSESNVCIWYGFFNDHYVNCPYDDCFDEGGCPVISPGGKKQSSGLGTKVTIGAVVLILVLLLLFMVCLFICRRCQVLCWSGPPASRPQRSSHQASRVEMTPSSGNVEVSGGHSLPTAPPLLPVTSTATPVHEDKDLPPPYESLFPSSDYWRTGMHDVFIPNYSTCRKSFPKGSVCM